MTHTTGNSVEQDFYAPITVRLPSVDQADRSLVRLGGQGPAFRSVSLADKGRVRLGGQGPVFRTVAVADSGKVRLGGQGPSFR